MLTYIQINAAKPREKAYSLSDSQGLHLAIQPNGSKLWRFKYRFLDKQKTLHLGGWPTISLADARIRRDEAKRSEEHTSELQSLMRISYAVFCLKKKKRNKDAHILLYEEYPTI